MGRSPTPCGGAVEAEQAVGPWRAGPTDSPAPEIPVLGTDRGATAQFHGPTETAT
jgi:hypothetical protein